MFKYIGKWDNRLWFRIRGRYYRVTVHDWTFLIYDVEAMN